MYEYFFINKQHSLIPRSVLSVLQSMYVNVGLLNGGKRRVNKKEVLRIAGGSPNIHIKRELNRII